MTSPITIFDALQCRNRSVIKFLFLVEDEKIPKQPPELPPRAPHQKCATSSFNTSSMQPNDKCSHVDDVYQVIPELYHRQRAPSQNTVPKDIVGESWSPKTKQSTEDSGKYKSTLRHAKS